MPPVDGYVLITRCPDVPGIVGAVAGYLAEIGATITESTHFNDKMNGELCMRNAFRFDGRGPPQIEIEVGLQSIASRFKMDWTVHDCTRPVRALIMVSRFGHCLFDLLHAWRAGLLPIDITGIVSNHDDMRDFTEWCGLPYHHIPLTKDNKAEGEAQLREIIADTQTELVILARYMQVLSTELSDELRGRCINIHHGFLPSFKGAKPYHQAFERGVKVIGATAHFVTSDLDEGPIIEQDTYRVDHSLAPNDLIAAGRDVETAVLRRAVLWYAQRRLLLNGSKTIVFR
ncbi:MAG: formyltetrahydrofolate deformylase [Sphingorhabdus sp.]